MEDKIGHPEWAINFTCEEPFDMDRLASMAITNHGEITGTEIEAMMLSKGQRLSVGRT